MSSKINKNICNNNKCISEFVLSNNPECNNNFIHRFNEMFNNKKTLNLKYLDNISNKDKCIDCNLNINNNNKPVYYNDLRTDSIESLDKLSLFNYTILNYNINNRLSLIKCLQQKNIFIDGIISLICFIIIIINIIDFEIVYYNRNIHSFKSRLKKDNNNQFDNVFIYSLPINATRIIMLILSLLCVFLNYKSLVVYDNMLKQNKTISLHDTFIKSHIYKLLLETLLLIAVPLPYLNTNFLTLFNYKNFKPHYINSPNEFNDYFKHNYETIVYSINLFKFYFYSKYFLEKSRFNTILVHDICYKFTTKIDMHFVVKCLMKVKGPFLITYILTHTIFVISYIIRIMSIDYTDSKFYFNNYSNCVFNVITAMTTVGYGEYTVTNNFGRIVIITSVLMGQFLISIMIYWVTNNYEFCKKENTSFIILKRKLIRNNLKNISVNIIITWYKMYKLKNELLNIYRNKRGILNYLNNKKANAKNNKILSDNDIIKSIKNQPKTQTHKSVKFFIDFNNTENIKLDYKSINSKRIESENYDNSEAKLNNIIDYKNNFFKIKTNKNKKVNNYNFNLNIKTVSEKITNNLLDNIKVFDYKIKLKNLIEKFYAINYTLFKDSASINNILYHELSDNISFEIEQLKISIDSLKTFKTKILNNLNIQYKYINELNNFKRVLSNKLQYLVADSIKNINDNNVLYQNTI